MSNEQIMKGARHLLQAGLNGFLVAGDILATKTILNSTLHAPDYAGEGRTGRNRRLAAQAIIPTFNSSGVSGVDVNNCWLTSVPYLRRLSSLLLQS